MLLLAGMVLLMNSSGYAGLLRHYELDDPSGTTMTESVAGANGTYIGSPSLNGYYLTLNGTDQRGDVGAYTRFFHTEYERNRSLAMWVRLDSTSTLAYFLGTTVPSGGHGWSFRYLADGKLNFIRQGIANHDSTVVSGISADTWTHVGYSLSGTTLKFYVDGVQLGANVVAATNYLNNGTPVVSLGAGGGASSPNTFMAGAIDDVRFYVQGYGANDNDPDVENENGGVLSAADFASLAAMTPIPEPNTFALAAFALLGLLARGRPRRR